MSANAIRDGNFVGRGMQGLSPATSIVFEGPFAVLNTILRLVDGETPDSTPKWLL